MQKKRKMKNKIWGKLYNFKDIVQGWPPANCYSY